MHPQQVQNLVDWVNSHSDGTPQPRARATFDGRSVIIQSTEYAPNGSTSIVEVVAHCVTDARDVLGY